MAKETYCLALDLVNDEKLIAEYKAYHTQVWPEIIASIKDAGIHRLDIYCTGNRLFMIIEAGENFSFERKKQMDEVNPTVQDWETLMWNYQQAVPWAAEGEKWILMDKIFELPQE